MSRTVQIVTPENIEVSYELAGIGSRFVAALIDHGIQVVALLLVLLLFWVVPASSGLVDRAFGGSPSMYVVAVGLILIFVIVFGYFIFFELLLGGRSPGKIVAGLRVIRDGGHPIDPWSSIVRNLVRIVDFLLPPIYGAGLVSIFMSREYKRLGDFAGGTLVIRERATTALAEGALLLPPSEAVAYYMPLVRNVDTLTPEEFQILRRFVQRRPTLELPVQAHLAMRLAPPLMQRLGMEAPIQSQLHYADVLEAIERRYVEEQGVLQPGVLRV